jgi:hypothetical protein
MNRISFTLPDVGLREIRGMVYLEEDFLVLKLDQALLGMIDAEKDIIKIDTNALRDLHVRRGLFRDRLVIRPKKSQLLDLVPGEHRDAVELRVRRKYRPDLMRLVEKFEEMR